VIDVLYLGLGLLLFGAAAWFVRERPPARPS